MKCIQIRERLSAFVDNEMSEQQKAQFEQHLAICPECRKKAATLKELGQGLDSLRAVPAPPGFSLRVCRAIRQDYKYPNFAQWWHQLTLTWRGVVCGTAMAGLLCGAMLGTSLNAVWDDSTHSAVFLEISDDGGFYL